LPQASLVVSFVLCYGKKRNNGVCNVGNGNGNGNFQWKLLKFLTRMEKSWIYDQSGGKQVRSGRQGK